MTEKDWEKSKSLSIIVQNYIKSEFPKEYSELSEVMQITAQKTTVTPIGEIYWSQSNIEISKKKKIMQKTTRSATYKVQSKFMKKYVENKGFNLKNILNSVGKAAFLNLYPLVKKNLEITADEIEKEYPQYKKTMQTRLSSTRSIIKNGMAAEALEIIAKSSRMTIAEQQTARLLLKELNNEIV